MRMRRLLGEDNCQSALTMLVGVIQCASTAVMDLRIQTALVHIQFEQECIQLVRLRYVGLDRRDMHAPGRVQGICDNHRVGLTCPFATLTVCVANSDRNDRSLAYKAGN